MHPCFDSTMSMMPSALYVGCHLPIVVLSIRDVYIFETANRNSRLTWRNCRRGLRLPVLLLYVYLPCSWPVAKAETANRNARLTWWICSRGFHLPVLWLYTFHAIEQYPKLRQPIRINVSPGEIAEEVSICLCCGCILSCYWTVPKAATANRNARLTWWNCRRGFRRHV
jgi:succinate dehydrogenase flavin-adding protein (antitoxin of CptAB toxin-antitoxin module)